LFTPVAGALIFSPVVLARPSSLSPLRLRAT
jgi:hypothetical protein